MPWPEFSYGHVHKDYTSHTVMKQMPAFVQSSKLAAQHDQLHNFILTVCQVYYISDFIWDFGKLPSPAHLGKYIIKNGKIST